MLKYKKCPNGHMYDASVFGENCPFCQKEIVGYATQADLQIRCSNCGTDFFSRNLEDLCCPNCGQRKINCNAFSIGRGKDCDIIVNSVYVNALHARIRYVNVNRRKGYFLYYDLSTNGTIIDGLLSRKGDVIKIPDNNCSHEILLAGQQDAKLDWNFVIKFFYQFSEYKECHKTTMIVESNFFPNNANFITETYYPKAVWGDTIGGKNRHYDYCRDCTNHITCSWRNSWRRMWVFDANMLTTLTAFKSIYLHFCPRRDCPQAASDGAGLSASSKRNRKGQVSCIRSRQKRGAQRV